MFFVAIVIIAILIVILTTKNTQTTPTPKVAILFTTYNVPNREAMYRERLEWWRDNTSLPLYVVDSANRGFNMDGIREYKFEQLPNINGPTDTELFSLRHAFDHFEVEWEKFDYVFKITGKYVLPKLETVINNIPTDVEMVLQSTYSKGEQSSEIIGFRSSEMKQILMILSADHQDPNQWLEKRLFNYTASNFWRLPQLHIPKKYRTPRSDQSILSVL